MTEDAELVGGLGSGEFRLARRVSMVSAFVLTAAFGASIYLYSAHGGGFVNGLSSRVGEVMAARARALAESGQHEAAASVFAEALKADFAGVPQRVWCYWRYGVALKMIARPEEAAAAFESALALDDKHWPSYQQLCDVLKRQGQQDRLREAAQRWQSAAAGISKEEEEKAQQYLK